MTIVYTIRNITRNSQAFDDKTLIPEQQVSTTALTDDLLDGWAKGHLSINPEPTAERLRAKLVTVNPCQLPLPVRMVGGFQGLYTPSNLKTLPTKSINTTPSKILGTDNSRVNFRLRNVGSYPIALGGEDLDWTTAVHILEPDALFEEHFAPNVAWYAVTETNTSALVGLITFA